MSKNKIKHFLKFTAVLTTILILMFSNSLNAFALNKNYVLSEYNGWIEVKDYLSYKSSDNGFDGILKQIADTEDNSFYIYFSFYDKRLKNSSDDDIVLTFTVKNSENTYTFSVNKNGFVNTGQNDMNAVDLAYNFDKCSCGRLGGEILIGFELKNNIDNKLTNYISCCYTSGIEKASDLFSDAVLDLYEEPTTKAEKTTKASNTVSGTEKSATEATDKSKENKESTTKYTPTGTVKADTTGHQSIEIIDNSESTSAMQSTADIDESIDQNQRLKMSAMSVVLIVIAVLLALAGIIILTICVADNVLKKKIITETGEKTNTEIEEESQSDDI